MKLLWQVQRSHVGIYIPIPFSGRIIDKMDYAIDGLATRSTHLYPVNATYRYRLSCYNADSVRSFRPECWVKCLSIWIL